MKKDKTKTNGCCKDEQKQVKIEKDQKTADKSIQLLELLTAGVHSQFIEIVQTYFFSVTEEDPASHAPPRSSKVAVYIRNCVFLI